MLEVLDFAGWPVTCKHNLLVGLVQRVEGVEELLDRLLLALHELDVIDEQEVDRAVAPLEGAGLLVAADILGRIVARPAEIDVGIVTALIGAPFFIWIVRRQRVRDL